MLFLFTGAHFVWLLRTFILTFHKMLEHLQSIIFQVVQNNKHCQCSGFTSTYTMQFVKEKCQCPVLHNDHTNIPIFNIHQLFL